tara:strand:+ start:759 stop:3539 length:2781 start_codon:yes stop_codon:yes gene_type:complete
MALTNAPKRSNVSENWLFDFTAENSHCLNFDGTNDYISWGDIFDGPFVNFTVEFWILADGNADATIFSLNSTDSSSSESENVTVIFRKLTSGEWRLFYEYDTGNNMQVDTNGVNMPDDEWHHIAVVRDNADNKARFYLDGVLAETENVANDPTGGDSDNQVLYVGRNTAGTNHFDGKLAHVRFWNVARSATQIKYSYNHVVDSSATGLIGYWKLDEGHGTSVADSSSNNNTGTVVGASWLLNGFTERIHAFGLAFKDTLVDNISYHGSILNKGMVVRDSIDITKGTSATGNITLNSANIGLFSTDLYKILFNGTNNYFNKEVHVYAQFNNESTLANCQRIFTGKLVDLKLDQNQVITMQINSHRPWDKVEIPNEKTDISNVYVPIVYGAYSPNTSTIGTPTLVGNELYPAPVLNTTNAFITTLMPRSYSSSSNAFLNKWFGNNTFLPARTGTSPFNVNETTEIYQGQNCIQTKLNKYWSGITKANEDDANTSNQLFTNIENAFDNDDSTFATSTLSSSNINTTLAIGLGEKKYHAQLYRRIHVFVKNSESEVVNVFATIGDGNYHTEEVASDQQTFSNASTVYEVVIDHRANNLPTSLSCQITFQHSSGTYGTLSVQKVHVEMSALAYGSTESDSGEKRIHMDNDAKSVTAIKYLYSGGAGLTESYTGGATAIAWGIEAFRDMMVRFAGHHRTAPTGWTSLYYDRRTNASGTDQNNWKIRYWQLEPVSLKDKLDQLAYEFGFVYKFAADGTLKVIHVLQSSELSATLDLSGYDLNNINVSTTGLSEIITKMTINNKLHPAERNRYESDVTNINTATRTKYNHGDKENIANINLDMNVGTIPTTANADCNADFYSYYNNIIGDMKVIVTCNIVNHAKGYQLETGDIVTFSSMPVEMFGTDFSASKYFMIVETKRSLGKVSIVAREVG